MSDGFGSGRRGVNVTQYLRNLDKAPEEAYPIEDLEMFTNTQFFDFESGQSQDFQSQHTKDVVNASSTASPADLSSQGPSPSMTPIFNFNNNFQFSDFSFPIPTLSTFPDSLSSMTPSTTSNGSPVTSQPSGLPHSAPTYTASSSSPRTGDKRKSGDSVNQTSLSPEEQARLAAEEDKRRRNTAASARFRIKKKQREQAMEKTTKELTEKNQVLEQRVQQLETENKWLRGLLIEKTGDNGVDLGKILEVVSKKSVENTGSKEVITDSNNPKQDPKEVKVEA